ncbi:MAG: hypothetical protein UX85_C0003G0036 [Candidatus Beckwithbacteria bacterium GW2011_GWB1_47_15]|uniref:Prepilin-type N-terminal cleavage/methylation domain-containing protein n=1 Tax=Candidatus Beckwithbacteria bacterium GW2011_GWB1_47_15 TaxID=1618371 RepID=A0A0G1RW56_9BACT|nr:MAG: hypothetical protein UY43_C0001G0428 [Candidatus Beckwithbacteria bacterium GW2011_GWC1_49_16]KKU35282.1 MAG: hypothetical protein UX50_C0004G0013 [Candidatus Beckwithbacteria bacterium GW2011_GWA1_46_30]KKU61377.1 MAG: hypothetical protein UX85_C0003G0036 [Candidatus Beckwithbacteria bacterium GW2011_GWB1_47_15]KKU71784.1 MAG: hypothetical protein UX97_C0003G0013 [Candidatus Beckwithbacteria bacterium GW2011_GWA2_47_25]KKW03017.1 MAG: hypothetical protein UY37_C0008G0021 [Candidatus Be
MRSKGFTLIEVLTVSGIMALFSLTIISVFLASVRGGTKARVVQRVRQNGDFAQETMARMVRAAETVTCGAGSLTLENPDGGESVFSQVSDGGVNRVASNSSQFLTASTMEASGLTFACYQGELGNQVVTINFTLAIGTEAGAQVQEKASQTFTTSVATRQYK